jgi:O-antigen ligase
MPERTRSLLLVILGAEGLIALAFFAGLWLGRPSLAVVVLALPSLVLLWAAIMGDDLRLLAILAFLFPLTVIEVLPGKFLVYLLYPLTLAIVTVSRFLNWQSRPEGIAKKLPRSAAVGLTLMGTGILLSLAHAVYQGWTSEYLLRYSAVALDVVWMAWAFGTVPRSIEQVRTLVAVVVVGAVVMCLGLVLLPPPDNEWLMGGKVIVAPFGIVNLNAIGTVAASMSVLLICLVACGMSTRRRVLAYLALVVMLVTLVVSRSRGAWLGFGVAYLYLLWRIRSSAMVLSAAVGLTVLLGMDSFSQAVFERVGQTGVKDPSLLGRLLLWKYALTVTRASPLLGVGMENYRFVKHMFGYPFPKAQSLRYNTHNLYLEFLADLGAVGLLLLVWLACGTIRGLEQVWRGSDAAARPVAIALAAGLIAYLTHGMWDALTWQPGCFVFLGVLFGLGMSVRRLAGAVGSSETIVEAG